MPKPLTARARTAALLLALVAASACSDSVASTDPTPTTAPCATTSQPSTGAPAGKVVQIDGTDEQTVGLPGTVSLPLIVHAKHTGRKSFVVRGVDASGTDTQVLAASAGAYDATFAVGFVDSCATPTDALHVETTGRWHLDITEARNAPSFEHGVGGTGDSVFVYNGAATPASITYAGTTRFIVTTYATTGTKLLVSAQRAFHGTASLPHGPVFVAVVADGAWTIQPSK